MISLENRNIITMKYLQVTYLRENQKPKRAQQDL